MINGINGINGILSYDYLIISHEKPVLLGESHINLIDLR